MSKKKVLPTGELTDAQCRTFVVEVRELLFFDGPETEWNGDTLAELGSILNRFNILGPEPKEEPTKKKGRRRADR